ncbi:MAG: glycosyltransferase [Planctomycetes bacterium]|nr:glycosyltransferase [Planctomycetota bacterium]
MDYDVVILTVNRPEVLKVSIPLILSQNRIPVRLIIVDASEDHSRTHASVIEAVGSCPIDLKILHSPGSSITLARNIGLEHVISPVVMYPDDDALWWPGVAEAIMRIYERDEEGDIGGVCGRETMEPPPEVHLAKHGGNKMRISDRIRQRIERVRHKFDNRFCPDPLWVYGKSRWNVRPVPGWLSNENAKLVEYMGGTRMSFRTKILREFGGFDEDLGRFIGWASCEDADASFKILQKYLIVGAHNAEVFHYKAPARRAGGFKLGFIILFNRAYVISHYAQQGSVERRAVKRFGAYKLLLYMLVVHTAFGRERVRGTFRALQLMDKLLEARPEQLRQRYLELCQQNIGPGK